MNSHIRQQDLPAINKCIFTHNPLEKWDRPPNFLLVDYYNWGKPNGSVFEVAAKANNVTWNGDCCGSTSAAAHMAVASVSTMVLVAAGVQFLLATF